MKIKTEYCECGCHGFETASIGNISWWIFDDLKGNIYVHRGHGRFTPFIGKFTNMKDVDEFIEQKAKEELDKIAQDFGVSINYNPRKPRKSTSTKKGE